jgi:hypothetical protein
MSIITSLQPEYSDLIRKKKHESILKTVVKS